MIAAVLDANVLSSGAVGFVNPQSTPGQIIRDWQADRFEVIVSDHLLAEVHRTLQKPYFQARLTSAEIDRFERTLMTDATHIEITVTVEGVAKHAEDDLILATAVSAQADYLITGDGPLIRAVPTYEGVRLVTPRQFLEILALDQG